MTIHNRRPTVDTFLSEGTVCFPVDRVHQRILLGMKKRGVGAGHYNGFGGKIEAGETPSVAAARELWEESGLRTLPEELQAMGHVIFPHAQGRMHLFVATTWEGQLLESNEMIPCWFRLTDLPYAQMWPTDRDWLPLVLAGRRVAVVVYKQADGQRLSDIRVLDEC